MSATKPQQTLCKSSNVFSFMQNRDHILAFFLKNEPPQISPQLQTQKYNQSVLSPEMVNKYEKCLSDAKTLQCV